MSGIDITIPAALDARPIAATLVGDPSTARALVTINPATAVTRAFYRPFAEHLAQRGFAALTFDWRANADARMRDWGERDLRGVLEWATKEHPRTPLAGFGHSAGGQMLALAGPLVERYQAFVGVAAQSGYYKHWPRPQRWRRAAEWFVGIPVTTALFGRVPKAVLGEPLPKNVAREWARWCRHPDYILRDDSDARRAGFARVRCPVLAYGFDDDDYGPPASVDWWAAQLVNAKVERAQRRGPVGHFGFFKPKMRATLWNEAVDFVAAAVDGRR